jgi:hypothetical protein
MSSLLQIGIYLNDHHFNTAVQVPGIIDVFRAAKGDNDHLFIRYAFFPELPGYRIGPHPAQYQKRFRLAGIIGNRIRVAFYPDPEIRIFPERFRDAVEDPFVEFPGVLVNVRVVLFRIRSEHDRINTGYHYVFYDLV